MEPVTTSPLRWHSGSGDASAAFDAALTRFTRPGVDPGPSRWEMPDPARADEHGLVAIGADLDPATVLDAYRAGLFPMPVSRRRLGWWSPDPRGVLPLDGLRVTRSLRQSARRYEVRVDTAFAEVIAACGRPERPHGWISPEIVDAYGRLYELGWVHSVEVIDDRGVLVGGLYGVRIGGLFAGESMFHDRRDASKVALVALVELMLRSGMSMLDVQWTTPHLVSLGALDVSRPAYLARLAGAVR